MGPGERAVILTTKSSAWPTFASYMVAGFVHGVLNTDNMNKSGESFDYGPWRWLPQWDPGFTAAYFDRSGTLRGGVHQQAQRPFFFTHRRGRNAVSGDFGNLRGSYTAARHQNDGISSEHAATGVLIDEVERIWAAIDRDDDW
jgi:hypothetical protein